MKRSFSERKAVIAPLFAVGLLLTSCSNKERPGEVVVTDSVQFGIDSVSIEPDYVPGEFDGKSSGHNLVDYYILLFDSVRNMVESDGGGGEHTSFGYTLSEFKKYKLLQWSDIAYDISLVEKTYLYENDSLLVVWTKNKDEGKPYVESLEEFKDGKVTTVERELPGAYLTLTMIHLEEAEIKPFQESIKPGYANQYGSLAENVAYYKNLVREWNLSIQEQNSYDSVSDN
jgi:hypothetical protein